MIPLQIWLFKASNPSSLVDISAKDIAKSFLVSGITPETKKEAIFIHFQQHKHGDDWKPKKSLMQDHIFG